MNRALEINAVELTVAHPALTDFYRDLVSAQPRLVEVGFPSSQPTPTMSLSPSALMAFFINPQSRPALDSGLNLIQDMVNKLNTCQNKFREGCGNWD